MASKGKNVKQKIDNNIDLSMDLDMGDFDFDSDPLKDDRKPITKAKDAFKNATKEHVRSTGFLKKTLLNALPQSFSDTLDFSEKVGKDVKGLYDESVAEIKPAIKDFKRVASKLAPKDSKYLPKSVKDLMKRWEDEAKADAEGQSGTANNRESLLAATITDAFKEQVSLGIKARAEDTTNDRLKQGLEISRHRDIFGILNQSNQHLATLSNYETKITLAYQKKSLEIQFRSLFVQQDMLLELRNTLKTNQDFFPKLVKNTGLPDYAKVNDSEHRSFVFKNKFYESMGQGLFGSTNQYIEKLTKNIRTTVLGKVKETVDEFRSGLGTAEEIKSQTEGMEDMPGMDTASLAGGGIAGLTNEYVVDPLAKRGAKWVKEKYIDPNPNVKKAAGKLEYGLTNVDRLLNGFKNSREYDETYDPEEPWYKKLFKTAARAAQGVMPGTEVDAAMYKSSTKDLLSAHPFTGKTDKTLNDIIPGYLSRILREIQVFRTGDESIELTTYNYSRDTFTSRTKSMMDLKKQLMPRGSGAFNDVTVDSALTKADLNGDKLNKITRQEIKDKLGSFNRKSTKKEITKAIEEISKKWYNTKLKPQQISKLADELIAQVNAGSSGINNDLDEIIKEIGASDLSDESKEEIKDRFLKNSTKGKEATAGNLSEGLTDKNKAEIEPIIAKYFESIKGDMDKQVKFSKLHNGLRDNFHDPRAQIQEMIHMGKSDELMALGLLKEDGKTFDVENYLNQYLGKQVDEEPINTNNPSAQANRTGPRSKLRKNRTLGPASLPQQRADQTQRQTPQAPAASQDQYQGPGYAAVDNWDEKKDYFSEKFDVLSKSLEKLIENTHNTVATEQAVLEAIKLGFTVTHQQQAGGDGANTSSSLNFGKGIPGLIGRAAYGATKLAGSITGGLFKLGKSTFDLSKTTAGMALSGIGNIGKFIIRVRDVWIQGEKKPRLLARNIKEGIYFDFISGKVLKSHRDIAGPVADNEGQIIISEDELDKMYIKNLGRLVKLTIKAAWGGIKTVGGLLGKYIPKMLRAEFTAIKFVGELAKKTLVGAWNLLDQPQDVYVPGFADPVLLKLVMNSGGYFSKLTNKVIRRPGDIDGPVVDKDGQVVLSLDQLRKGLFSVKGTRIKTSMQKIFSALGSAATSIKDTIASTAKAAWRVTKSIARGVGRFASGVGNALLGNFSIEINGKKSLSVLEQIRDFIFSTFGRKRKITGDVDGDGVRENSYEDLKRKAAAKITGVKDGIKNTIADKINNKENPGIIGKLFSKFFSKKDKVAEESLDKLGDIRDILAAQAAGSVLGGGDGPDLPDGKGGKGKPGTKPKGRFGRMMGNVKSLGGSALKFGMKAAPLAGAAMGAYGAVSAAKEGNYGEAALNAGLGVGSLALAGGSIGAGTLSTLGAVGGGLLTFVSSPVVLGVAAAALAGYGIYKGVKYLQNNTLSPIDKIRYVQYGFQKDKTDEVSKMFELESYLKDFLKTDKDVVSINEADLDIPKMLGIFGLDGKDKDDMELFFNWYQKRFKPIFLTHCTAINTLTGSRDVNKANDLKDEEKKAYIEAIKFPDGPYSFNALPLKSSNGLYRVSSSKDVTDVIEEALLALKLTKVKSSDKLAQETAKTNIAKSSVAEVISDPSLGTDITGNNEKKLPGDDVSTVSTLTKDQITGSSKATALLAVKYKTYGLVDLDPSKIRAIKQLEKIVSNEVEYADNSTASFTGNDLKVLDKVAGMFGVTDIFGAEANNWCKWFRNRFLPVYLNYLTGHMVLSGKPDNGGDLSILKPIQQLDLAKILSGLTGIWSNTDTPWPGYALNTDSSTIKVNIAFLEDVAKAVKLDEEKKTAKGPDKPQATSPVNADKDSTINKSTLSDSKTEAASPIDSEAKPKSINSGGGVANTPSANVPMAPGELASGANAINSIIKEKGVTFDGVNASFLRLFYGMVEEYNALTGKKVGVNDAFRSYQQQVEMKKKYGSMAAAPGNSLHEFGLAIDANSASLNEMESMGLMKKYGLTRPIGQEPWHIEPAGIQADSRKYRGRQDEASGVIDQGKGRGGGGMGTIADAPKGSFNRDYQIKLLAADSKPTLKDQESKTLAARANQPATITPPGAVTAVDKTIAQVKTPVNGENKPPDIQKQSLAANTPANTMPSDPSAAKEVNSPKDLKALVEASAKTVGIDPNIALATVAVESSFNPNAKAKGKNQTASGLYQMTNATWSEVVSKHGAKYGLDPGTANVFDPKANSLMGAQYIKSNIKSLSNSTGKEVGPTEAYIGHMFGPTGGARFLNEMARNPDAIGEKILPDAAASNKDIFYDKGRPRTLSEIYTVLNEKVYSNAKRLGINLPQSNKDTKTAATPAASSSPVATNESMVKTVTTESANKDSGFVKTKTNVSDSIKASTSSPYADSYGINPDLAIRKENSVQNTLTDQILKPTEDLLKQSLDTERKMLEVLTNIFGLISNKSKEVTQNTNASSSPAPTTAPSAPYGSPKVTVPMRKSIV